MDLHLYLTEKLDSIPLTGIEIGIMILLVIEFSLIFFGDEWTNKNRIKWFLLKTITTMLILCQSLMTGSILMEILALFLIVMFTFDVIFTIIDFKNERKNS